MDEIKIIIKVFRHVREEKIKVTNNQRLQNENLSLSSPCHDKSVSLSLDLLLISSVDNKQDIPCPADGVHAQ